MPFGTLQSVDIQVKFYGDRPRGTPPSEGGFKRNSGSQNIAILDLSKAISRKRCKRGGKLLLITNRKLHNERLTGTKLDDLE